MTEVEEQVEFKFSELSESAKAKARDEYRSGDYPGYEWWDTTYEDAVRMGALMGINITSTHHASSRKGHPGYDTIDISFSGFYSQGDGASFEGNYEYVPDAVARVTAETDDAELIRIAQGLTLLQLTRRLQGLDPFSARIKTPGNSCHSMTMDVLIGYDEDADGIFYSDSVEQEVTQLMRDFAGWVYEQLEAEDEYLNSDEYVDGRLNDSDDLYDEYGVTI